MININDIKYSVDQCMKSDYIFGIVVSQPCCKNCYSILNYPKCKTCNNCNYYNNEPIYLSEKDRLNILRKEKIQYLKIKIK